MGVFGTFHDAAQLSNFCLGLVHVVTCCEANGLCVLQCDFVSLTLVSSQRVDASPLCLSCLGVEIAFAVVLSNT